MITYELAKKLKDAGFPIGGDSRYFFDSQGNLMNLEMQIWSNGEEHKKKVNLPDGATYIPTISELIEACGFGLVVSYDSDKSIAAKEGMIVEGKSPEEAVANLWLELNKKQLNQK